MPMEAMMALAVLRVGTYLVNENAGKWNELQREMMLAELRQIDLHDPFSGNAMLEWDKQLAAREGRLGPDKEWFQSGQSKVVAKLKRAIKTLE